MKYIDKQKLIQKLSDNHYSDKTTLVYSSWILRFSKYHHLKNDDFEIGHIQKYLNHLTAGKQLKPSTHNQALNAVVFFYQKILSIKISKSTISKLRVDYKKNTLVILSKQQIENIACHLKGYYQLLTYLLYGCGLRSSEALNLKVKDIDFTTNQLTVSNSEHNRVLSIPSKITHHLENQIKFVEKIYHKDIKSKFFNNIGCSNCYLFPMGQLCNDINGKLIRPPIISNTLNYNITIATKKAGINLKVSTQTFRHSYAVHLLQNQISLKTVQKLLGHKYTSSTLIYSYIVQQNTKDKALSPLDLD